MKTKLKEKIKRKLKKIVNLVLLFAITTSTFSGLIPIQEVHALASGVTGDQIIETGMQYYSDWGYYEVGTCTGFVTRTLNRLGIYAVVGDHPYNIYTKQTEGGARRSPLAMYNNAMANPQDAKLVWQGYVKDINGVANKLKNGDLIITRPEDRYTYTGDGHVAFIRKYGTTISQYGAGSNGVGDAVMTTTAPAVQSFLAPMGFQSFNSGPINTGGINFGDFDWLDQNDLPIGNTITVHPQDWVTVFRLLSDEPMYGTLNSTKTSTESVQVSFLKTDVENNTPLSDAVVDFYRDDVKFATGTTDAQGYAKATFTNTYTATSGTFEFVTNWDDLDAEGQQKVIDRGAYRNRGLAQAQADSEAQQKANAMANKYHKYTVVETTTKTKYWLNPDYKTVTDSITGSGQINVSLTNARVRGTLNLTKVDADTLSPDRPQNEAVLDGALYGLYARTNILDPADGSIIYRAGEEITRVRTQNSKASVSDLYLGDYFWKEITPSKGYMLDTTEYNVELAYQGQDVKLVTSNTTVKEKVIVGDFDLEKIITNAEGSEVVKKEEGAEFLVVAKKFVNQYGSIEEAWEHRSEFTNKEYDHLITNSKGFAKTRELAFGDFVIKNIKSLDDTDLVPEWIFTVKEENQDTIRYIANNRPFTSYLKIVKKDAETGKKVTMSSATFQIKNEKGELLTQKVGETTSSEWTTNSEGYIVLPLELKAGNWMLYEINNPDNYVLFKEGVPFKITNTHVIETDEDGDPIFTVEMQNTPVKGQISIEKRGETLVGTKKDSEGNIQFVYEEQRLAGMIVHIIAKENIIDPADGSVIYYAGEVVEVLETSKDEETKSSLLPLGEYAVKEIQSPNLMVLDSNEYDVSITYKDNETPIIFRDVKITNDRQKVEASVTKKSSNNKTVLPGAIFGLYAKTDIYLGEELLISEGTLLEKGTTNDKGIYKFILDLPITMDYDTFFILKEIEAPNGFYQSEKIIDIDTTYKGQNVKLINNNIDFFNEIKKYGLVVNKIDDKTLEHIKSKDFAFTRYADEECTIEIETVYANQETGTALFDNINYGITWIRESSAPTGYALSPEIVKVEVNDEGFFINDVLIEEVDDLLYSITYQNTLLPVIQTNNNTNIPLMIILLGTSIIGMVIVLKKKRK